MSRDIASALSEALERNPLKIPPYQSYLKRAGSHYDTMHPGRGFIEAALTSSSPLSELKKLSIAFASERDEMRDELRFKKNELARLSGIARATGQYADPEKFSALRRDINKLTGLSTHLERLMSVARDHLKDLNSRDEDRLFREEAKRHLPPEVFKALLGAAQDKASRG